MRNGSPGTFRSRAVREHGSLPSCPAFLDDKVHQLLLDVDDLAWLLPLQPFRELRVLTSQCDHLLLAGISRYLDLAAQLAVDLDRNGQAFTRDERGVVLWPRLLRNTWCLSQTLPYFFGDVWREG